jgi:asparagine N-glycosylation enzyme membrane subunit Stt3
MLGLVLALIIAFLSMFIPGLLLSFALLRKSELHTFETVMIGFIFGLIAPATLTWLEGYLINYIHAFTFSLWLFELNALVLTIVGAILCWREGVFSDLKAYMPKGIQAKTAAASAGLEDVRHRLNRFTAGKQIVSKHIQEYNELRARHASEVSSASKLSEEERSKITALHKETQERLLEEQLREERMLLQDLENSAKADHPTPNFHKPVWWIWAILIVLMIATFYTRMQSIVTAPKFFEFDPYFDMIDAHYILTYGKQLLLDPSAWPVVAAGTNHRLQPLVPYLEAYWYSLVNTLQYHHLAFSSSLMSYVGGVYPPITAALLVFVIFMLLYHEYDEKVGLIGAALTAMMPVLLSTFVAGEQLVEPIGIFTLFFFFAAYMLAIRNMKDKKLAILAGIAFASTFLGAHYYTVTAGVLVLYILAQGIIDVLRAEPLKDFYKMNIIVIATIIIFYALYAPYQATLQSNLSSILGIPIIIAAPALALVLVAVLDYLPKLLAKRKLIIKSSNFKTKLAVLIVIGVILLAALAFTKLGNPVKSYIALSTKFTTPSKPLFMTVQEYIPTGPLYAFGGAGFGAIGAGFFGVPILIWLVCIISIMLIFTSIAFRGSKTGIFYISAALPLMVAGFSEVKYLPHFGVAYILLFCIALGEAMYLVCSNYYKNERNRNIVMVLALVLGVISLLIGFSLYSFGITDTIAFGFIFAALLVLLLFFTQSEKGHYDIKRVYSEHQLAADALIIMGLFFIFGIFLAFAALAFIVIYRYGIKHTTEKGNQWLIVLCVALALLALVSHLFIYGENSTMINAITAQYTYLTNPSNACTIMSNNNNQLGYSIYCTIIPTYWLNSMAWIRNNVGPTAPRVLAWWDYGDWINWFGNSNAVLRGDNSVASEDYAVAAQYVLGPRYNTTPQTLASYMNGNQTRYVLFDQDLIQKWGALDFLGCVNVNATSQAYAIAQGQAQNPPVPYALGASQCEVSHDPEFALIPLSALEPSANTSQQSIDNYCSISNSKNTYIKSFLVLGNSVENNTVCISSTPNQNGVMSVYSSNGTKTNAVIQSTSYTGVENIPGSGLYVQFIMIYLPNANGTVTNAPSEFYNSNFYRGFFLGNLPGFQQVYPSNAAGVNFVNGTYPIRIFRLVNYTGGLPPVPPKPSWIHNNDTMP